MSKYYCNPMNLPYKYNFQKPNMAALGEGKLSVYRARRWSCSRADITSFRP